MLEVESRDMLANAKAAQEKDAQERNILNYNGDWRSYLETMVSKGDAASADKLLNFLMTEESEQKARDWTASREDTQYQRLVSDLKAAGINPYVLMASGGSPVSSSSSGASYSGSQYTSKKASEETARHNQTSDALKIFSTILSTLAIVAAIAL